MLGDVRSQQAIRVSMEGMKRLLDIVDRYDIADRPHRAKEKPL